MNIPASLTAGDTWSWVDSLSDYPSPTYVLTYWFRGPKAFKVVLSQSGSDHAASVAASTTADYPPGEYQWFARAVGATSTVVGRGTLLLQPNLAASGEYRDFWQRAKESLQAVIENRATTDQLSFSIGGRALQRMEPQQLLDFYNLACRKVAASLGEDVGRIGVRFERA